MVPLAAGAKYKGTSDGAVKFIVGPLSIVTASDPITDCTPVKFDNKDPIASLPTLLMDGLTDSRFQMPSDPGGKNWRVIQEGPGDNVYLLWASFEGKYANELRKYTEGLKSIMDDALRTAQENSWAGFDFELIDAEYCGPVATEFRVINMKERKGKENGRRVRREAEL